MEAITLDTIDMRRLGQELKQAREQRGLTQEEAAALIDVGRTTMVAIEKGERRIRPDELIRLARAYGRSVGTFMRARPEIAPFRVQFRGPIKRKLDDDEAIRRYVAAFEALCRDYYELEQLTDAPLPREYPSVYKVAGLPPRTAAEEVAVKERHRLGLGSGPLGDLRTILEEKVGLRIFYMALRPSTFSEMYHYDDDVGGCIAINRLHPPGRRLWSLAHGYAHFLVHRYEPTAFVENAYERLPERERFADYFALHFTMPKSEVLQRYHEIIRKKGYPTPADLLILADYFGVSVAAVTRRLEAMHRLKTGTWERLKARGFKVRAAQQALGIEQQDPASQEFPNRYLYLALDALERGLISEGQFACFLRVDRLQARTVAEALREQPGGITDETLIDLDLTQSLEEETQEP